MAAVIDAFSAWCAETERHVIEWSNPNLAFDARVTAGWPLVDLETALYVFGGYMLMVLFGCAIRPSKVAAPSAKPAKKLSPMEAFAAEPIRVLQAAYNLVQVVLCAWMITGTLYAKQTSPEAEKLWCLDYDTSDVNMATMLWVFYASKVLDMMDTFFIIYRGGWTRFSFLHIYHHASIFMVYWLNVNVGYAGDIYYTIVLNSFVHLLMYYYYLSSSLGSTPKWGKYLTMFQMFQFITMNIQAAIILMNPDSCQYPRRVTLIYLFYIQSLFVLFFSFFQKKHGGKKKSSKKD